MTDHTIKVVVIRVYNEWRPECTCGWVGSYWGVEGPAWTEADKHVQEAS